MKLGEMPKRYGFRYIGGGDTEWEGEQPNGEYCHYSDYEDASAKLSEAQRRVESLETTLGKINDLRNDIVGRQAIGFSRHVYPLVAILNEAGFLGMKYEDAKRKVQESEAALRVETK